MHLQFTLENEFGTGVAKKSKHLYLTLGGTIWLLRTSWKHKLEPAINLKLNITVQWKRNRKHVTSMGWHLSLYIRWCWSADTLLWQLPIYHDDDIYYQVNKGYMLSFKIEVWHFIFRRGSRKNTDRFPTRGLKGKLLRGSRGMLHLEIFFDF